MSGLLSRAPIIGKYFDGGADTKKSYIIAIVILIVLIVITFWLKSRRTRKKKSKSKSKSGKDNGRRSGKRSGSKSESKGDGFFGRMFGKSSKDDDQEDDHDASEDENVKSDAQDLFNLVHEGMASEMSDSDFTQVAGDLADSDVYIQLFQLYNNAKENGKNPMTAVTVKDYEKILAAN